MKRLEYTTHNQEINIQTVEKDCFTINEKTQSIKFFPAVVALPPQENLTTHKIRKHRKFIQIEKDAYYYEKPSVKFHSCVSTTTGLLKSHTFMCPPSLLRHPKSFQRKKMRTTTRNSEVKSQLCSALPLPKKTIRLCATYQLLKPLNVYRKEKDRLLLRKTGSEIPNSQHYHDIQANLRTT
ncbi:unnamed protein product, partial [Trichogramma brassicae]